MIKRIHLNSYKATKVGNEYSFNIKPLEIKNRSRLSLDSFIFNSSSNINTTNEFKIKNIDYDINSYINSDFGGYPLIANISVLYKSILDNYNNIITTPTITPSIVSNEVIYNFNAVNNYTLTLPKDIYADVLCVGGGGNGGIEAYGGGGGAGEIIYINNMLMPSGTYNITINDRILQYPPKAFNSSSGETLGTYLGKSNVYYQTFTLNTTGIYYGSGIYEIYSSTSGGSDFLKDKLFNFNTSETTTSTHFLYGEYLSGNYNKSNFLVSGYLGDWIVLKLTESISLSKFTFVARNSEVDRAPGIWRCYGSNDGINWTIIQDACNETIKATYTTNIYTKVIYSITPSYNYIGFTINKLQGTDVVLNFIELQLFGRKTPNVSIIKDNEIFLQASAGGNGGSLNYNATSGGSGGGGRGYLSISPSINVNTISGSSDIYYSFISGTYTFTTNTNIICDILVVGGGGAGNLYYSGGGGGAGALIYQQNITLNAGTYTITIGNGGISGVSNGGDSIISLSGTEIYKAKGGGLGGGTATPADFNGKAGGCGGGGAGNPVATIGGTAVSTNIPTGVYGYAGGAGKNATGLAGGKGFGGGGGGASQVGENATTTRGGNGGNGTSISITGIATYYAGGGGGGAENSGTIGLGGLGGGGNGDKGAIPYAGNGVANTGGGGGGSGYTGVNGVPGNGGSGVVIIRIKNFFQLGAVKGTAFSNIYTIGDVNNGGNGSSSQGGNGGSASTTSYNITGSSVNYSVGGTGATNVSTPTTKTLFGYGGDGNGGVGMTGCFIIRCKNVLEYPKQYETSGIIINPQHIDKINIINSSTSNTNINYNMTLSIQEIE